MTVWSVSWRTCLALDEARDGHASRSCAGEEGLELVADDLMEEGLLGLVTFVPVDGYGCLESRAYRRDAG